MKSSKKDISAYSVPLRYSVINTPTAEGHQIGLKDTRLSAEGCRVLLAAWDRLLAPGNEVIPGEAMLKMNHLLPIPYRHFFFFFFLGPCTLRPSILQHREG